MITIRNTSNSLLESVVRIAIPANYPLPQFPVILNTNKVLPLLFEKNVGNITKIYTAKGFFEPGNSNWQISSDENAHRNLNFVLSDWTAKSPATSIPRILIKYQDGTVKTFWFGTKLNHIRATQHLQTFEIQSQIENGWMCKQYVTAYSDLDHLDLKLRVNWADQSNPNYNIQIQKMTMVCSDQFKIYYADQMGLPNPVYDAMNDLWYLDLLTNQQIRDGQGVEIRGVILTNPESFVGTSINDLLIKNRLSNLDAVKNGIRQFGSVGAVYGVFQDLNYEGNWFNKYLPEHFIPFTFRENLITTPGILGERSIGCTKTPGQSGSQQDFGADKGFEATVCHDPGWIAQAIASQVDGMRTFNIHRPNGDRVTRTTNPGRVTWSMETFDPLTQDTLGKTKWAWRDAGTGWNSYDNQHRSQNNTFAYYALTGDELTLDILLNGLEADLQQARNLDLADREVGRMALYWSKMLRVLPTHEAERLKVFIGVKLTEFFQDWRGRFLENDPSRTVRCSQVILDARSGIVNPSTNKLEPSWICYQHAQMISGLYSLLQVSNGASWEARLTKVLKDLCKTYIMHGVFQQNGVWYPIIFQRYRTGLESGVMIQRNIMAPDEGLPLEPEAFNLNSWEIKLDLGNNGWWDWVGPAIAISRFLLEDQSLKDKATQILNQVYPTGLTNIESASWYPLSIQQ